MRYVSKYQNLVLPYNTSNVVPPVDDPQPKAKYNFYFGTLIVGDPALSSAGNVIVTTDLMVLFPALSGASQYGKDVIWFEAPEIVYTTAITAGKVYKVLRGSVVNNSITYTEGQTFTAVGTAFTGTGVIALDNSNFFTDEVELDLRTPWYKIINLSSAQDEATWNNTKWTSENHTNPWTWIR